MRSTMTWIAGMAGAVSVLGLTSPDASARTMQLSATAIYIEINDTDGDAGVQIFLDGDGWDSMMVTDPSGNTILDVIADGSVGIQGITELYLESAEPSFDEQPLEELFALFPEGNYRFQGMTTEGVTLMGKAKLTHALPAAPLLVSPGEDDAVNPDNTVIEWQVVPDPPGSRITGYQIVVERDTGSLRVFSVDVGPETTSVTVPPEFMEAGAAYKYEVLAIEASGNRTISASEFETE